MAEIWLALLLVATLGSVDPAASAVGVAEVKNAWELFKPPNSVPAEITTCNSLPCDSGDVDPDAVGVNVGTLCTAVDTYVTCAGGCSLTDTQKQQLKAVEDLCKTAKLETALPVIKGKCSGCDTDADAVDTASGLDGKCQTSLTYIQCVDAAKKATTCDTVDDADVEALRMPCKGIPLYDFESAVSEIKVTCPSGDCDSTAVDGATGLDDKCLASLSYIGCVASKCTSVDVEALKTPCKDKSIPLFDFGIALIDVKKKCPSADCDSTDVDDASELDDKCLASLTYIECVGEKTNCDSVFDDEKKALKTPCKGESIPLYDLGIALMDIKENCDCESTTMDSASVLDDKCLASQAYLTCVTTSCTSVPDDDVEALRTPCKEILFGKAMTTIKGNCDNSKCDSTDVDSASGINAKCLESESYIACVTTKCNTTVTATDVEALKTPCKVSTLSGGDGGDDDGCSILQVSILALMLSLLISII